MVILFPVYSVTRTLDWYNGSFTAYREDVGRAL